LTAPCEAVPGIRRLHARMNGQVVAQYLLVSFPRMNVCMYILTYCICKTVMPGRKGINDKGDDEKVIS